MPPLMPAMTLRGGETTEITGAWAARPARGARAGAETAGHGAKHSPEWVKMMP